jgi:hypothetical protein
LANLDQRVSIKGQTLQLFISYGYLINIFLTI